MQDSVEFWDFYWEVQLQNMEDLGKREAILVISKLIRRLAVNADQKVRLLQLGCGEGQIIGALVEAHSQVPSINASHGVDYSHKSIEICRRLHPGMSFTEGDFTNQDLIAGLGQFEIRASGGVSMEAKMEQLVVKEEVRRALRRFFNKTLERRPVILPVIIEI